MHTPFTRGRRAALPLIILVLASLACSLSMGDDSGDTPPPVQSPAFSPFPTPFAWPTVTFPPTLLPATAVPTATACTRYTAWPLYTVVTGDTLGNIAQRAGTTTAQLAAANCLADTNLIYAGQQLYVPQIPATNTPGPTATFTSAPNAPVFGQAITASQHWRDSAGQAVTYYQTVRVSVGEVTNADSVSFFVTGTTGGAAAYIGQDRDPWDGAFIDYTFPAPGTYTFQAAAENESARVNSGSFTIRYDPNFVPPGTQQYNTLTFAPAVSTSGGWTTLRAGTAVTITWPDAPGGAARVDFTLTPTGGAARTIGSDANPLDGAAITWTVPAGTSGQVQGRATMPNGQVISSEAAGVIAQ